LTEAPRHDRLEYRGGPAVNTDPIDALWANPFSIKGDTSAQDAAAYLVLEKYSDETKALATAVKALYFGAYTLHQENPACSQLELYQGCIVTLVREGISIYSIVEASKLLVDVFDAIQEAS
jgi:hypothetical protein